MHLIANIFAVPFIIMSFRVVVDIGLAEELERAVAGASVEARLHALKKLRARVKEQAEPDAPDWLLSQSTEVRVMGCCVCIAYCVFVCDISSLHLRYKQTGLSIGIPSSFFICFVVDMWSCAWLFHFFFAALPCLNCTTGEQHDDQRVPAQEAQGRLDERQDDRHGWRESCRFH